jgi:hypothetical protein
VVSAAHGVPGDAGRRLAVATVAAKNFWARVRVLANSLAEHNNGFELYALLSDELDDRVDPGREPFNIVRLNALGLTGGQPSRLAFGYDRKALAAALKPLLLRKLLADGYERVLLIDADSMVLGSLHPVADALDEHRIVLSPHRLHPERGVDAMPTDLRLLRTGTFNGGLVGVRRSPQAREFLEWWWEHLERRCVHDVHRGLHLDQRWLDLVPGFFEGVHVLRDGRFNAAYWNFDQGVVVPDDGTDAPSSGAACRLFHFSGYDPARPKQVTSYLPHLRVDEVGPAARLFHGYRELLLGAGQAEIAEWPYAYAHFDNGVVIPDVVRRIYHELGEAGERHGDPFLTAGAGSFFAWLNAPSAGAGASGPPIPNLWMEVYRRRADVRREYPDLEGSDRLRFLEWTTRSGLREHGIPEVFACQGAERASGREAEAGGG